MMVLSYRLAARIAGGVFAVLCATLILVPEVILWLFDLAGAASAEVLAKRAGILFLGLALVLFLTQAHGPNPTRKAVQQAGAVMLCAMAVLGAAEWLQDGVGPGIWLAILAEILLAGVLAVAR
ncbi:hypothetical protein [Dinoroseobacter sp. S124A]|uniref:hypothetical protein n=1 Tax=Dinoroseobacter sp. S124A TaxID=3415128 RepID=UPI003C7B37DD